jgi:hypothetical protein
MPGPTLAGVRWEWLDVEDREDLVDDVDVETFPTLLIGQGARFLPGAAAAAARCWSGWWRLLSMARRPRPSCPEATPLFQRVTAALA